MDKNINVEVLYIPKINLNSLLLCILYSYIIVSESVIWNLSKKQANLVYGETLGETRIQLSSDPTVMNEWRLTKM